MATLTDLRDGVQDLATLAANDLRGLWRQVTNLDEAREALEDILPMLVRTYGLAAGTLAANWYDDLRDELNVERRFAAIVAELDDQGADVLARWGVKPLLGDEPDWRRAQVLVEGGLQRRIANGARETVRISSIEDSQAQGWMRAGGGDCAFCDLLISRGAVYTEATADFAAHDHCRCTAVPAFRGRPKPVRPYTPSARNVSDADRARVREYLATHDAG